MRNRLLKISLPLLSFVIASPVLAANALTTEQLTHSIQESVADYKVTEPEMAESISGLRVATVGASAQVVIEMKTDGMNMTAKYTCVAQGQAMACRQQQ